MFEGLFVGWSINWDSEMSNCTKQEAVSTLWETVPNYLMFSCLFLAMFCISHEYLHEDGWALNGLTVAKDFHDLDWFHRNAACLTYN